MHSVSDFVKNTVLGGVFFLLPLALLIFLGGELLNAMSGISGSVSNLFFPGSDYPVTRTAISVMILLTMAFVAGLVGRTALGSAFSGKLDRLAAANVPGYALIRQSLQGMAGLSEQLDEKEKLRIVRVNIGQVEQIGLVAGSADGLEFLVYLPDAPNVMKGRLVIVGPDQISETSLEPRELLFAMNNLGRGLPGFTKV